MAKQGTSGSLSGSAAFVLPQTSETRKSRESTQRGIYERKYDPGTKLFSEFVDEAVRMLKDSPSREQFITAEEGSEGARKVVQLERKVDESGYVSL